MANSLNLCQFIGRLGADPDVRYTTDGTAVANFSIACDREWKDKDSGEKTKQTEWVRCVAFNKLAEICSQYLKKGQQIYAAGRMQTRKWQDKEGNDRYSTEIVLDSMQMLGGKREDAGDARAEQQYGQSNAGKPAPKSSAPSASAAKPDFDDDIPF